MAHDCDSKKRGKRNSFGVTCQANFFFFFLLTLTLNAMANNFYSGPESPVQRAFVLVHNNNKSKSKTKT